MKKIIISVLVLASISLLAEVHEIKGTFNVDSIPSTLSEIKAIADEQNQQEGGEPAVIDKPFHEFRPSVLISLDEQMANGANKGNLKNLNTQYEQALDSYLESVSYDSTKIFYLANQYMILNNYDRANQIFLKDNKDLRNVFGAATTYRFMGQNKNAIEKYNQAISINSAFAESYLGRGLAYRNLDMYDEAIKDLKNYLAMTHSHDAYIALADVYFKTEKNKDAYNIASEGLSRYGDSRILKTLANNILKNKID